MHGFANAPDDLSGAVALPEAKPVAPKHRFLHFATGDGEWDSVNQTAAKVPPVAFDCSLKIIEQVEPSLSDYRDERVQYFQLPSWVISEDEQVGRCAVPSGGRSSP